MPVSQNGYTAGLRSLLHNPIVPGTTIDFPGGLRKGPSGDLLLYAAAQLHKRVENGKDGYGMWGYAYRPVRGFQLPPDDARLMAASRIPGLDRLQEIHRANRPCCFDNEDQIFGSSRLSNHSSGTAFDWHAPRHPLGASGTFSVLQVRAIHTIINVECEGAVRWGGDYLGRKDEMHFEVVKDESFCARVLRKLNAKPALPVSSGSRVLSYTPDKPVMAGDDVKTLQRVLNSWYQTARPVWWPLALDGEYGPRTVDAVRHMQKLAGLEVDGVFGPSSRKVLGI